MNIYLNKDVIDVEKAKSLLLHKMYHARYKQTMGGYDVWLKLLDLYYLESYTKMIRLIHSFKGPGGKTRNECVELIHIIQKSNKKKDKS